MEAPCSVTVTIWSLSVSASRLARLHAILSPDEQARAARILREAAAHEYIASRGVARELLALYCGCAPGDIAFGTGTHGKPHLERPQPGMAFNLSHSGGFCALATGGVTRVGVDIETIRLTVTDIAASVFTPREAIGYAAISPPGQMRVFFRAWVAKEAYLKATGEGLGGGLKSLELELAASSEILPIAIRGSVAALAQWQFHGFDVNDAIVGAVAIETGGATVEVKVRHVDAEGSLSLAGRAALSP